MVERDVIIDGIFSILFGFVVTTLALVLSLIYIGLPFVQTPESLITVAITLILLGGVGIGGLLFVLRKRVGLGWTTPTAADRE